MGARPDPSAGVPEALVRITHGARRLGTAFVRRYHALTVAIDAPVPAGQVLFVANHGFGGLVDLNVFAVLGVLDEIAADRSLTFLTHELAWTLRVGPLIESLGAVPASPSAARDAFAAGDDVVVFPGGDVEAGKAYKDRDRIMFGGRSGFAQLAIDAGVPIIPIVTAGAGESLWVIDDGRRLARGLRLDRLLRVKALPISVSVPWGVSVGLVGLVPYLPLPTKLASAVLPAVVPQPEESAPELAARVERAMQERLEQMPDHGLAARMRPDAGAP